MKGTDSHPFIRHRRLSNLDVDTAGQFRLPFPRKGSDAEVLLDRVDVRLSDGRLRQQQ